MDVPHLSDTDEPMSLPLCYRKLVEGGFDWERWEGLIEANGVTVDRPRGSVHPVHAEITYPIDYGFVDGTISSDGEPVDIFVGTGRSGLVGAILTTDYRKGDREAKLIYRCTAEEVYVVNGFINFDRKLMEGELVMRQSMREMWLLEDH